MGEAAKHFVDLNALQQACGKRIAQLCRCPDGYGAFVTTGAAAGQALVTATCMAGDNMEVIQRLPETTEEDKRHVVMDGGHDLRWLQSIRSTGAHICLLGNKDRPMTLTDLEAELSGPRRGRHACILIYEKVLIDSRHVPLAEILTAAQRFNVPVVVDAAAQLPPRSNLWRWTHQGVDAVIFSGGKSLRGPQTSGLVLARSELVRKMALNGSPHETTVCRPMKCSKEDMVGLVKAVELYVQDTDEKDFKRYQDVLDIIEAGLKSVPGIAATQQRCPSPGYIQPNTVPRLFIDLIEGPSFTEKKESATSEGGMYAHNVDFGNPLAINPVSAPTALARHLAVGTPTVCVNTSATGIIISPLMMTVKDARPVLQKIVDVCQHMVQVGELLEK